MTAFRSADLVICAQTSTNFMSSRNFTHKQETKQCLLPNKFGLFIYFVVFWILLFTQEHLSSGLENHFRGRRVFLEGALKI